ncbi:MAG: hypothetical protein R3D85_15605 [Paracoccaceae bacterium]
MDAPPTLRLVNLTHLQHPMSVDLHLDATATRSRLVIARVLGGTGYWRYGVEQYSARLHAAGVPLVLLPGDDKPDAELRALSTVADEDYDALWAYLVEGGPQNSANFLTYAGALLSGGEKPAPAAPLTAPGSVARRRGGQSLRRPRAVDRRRAGRSHRLLPLVQGAGSSR